MKIHFTAAILLLAFFAFGCNSFGDIKTVSNTNSTVKIPTSSATVSATPTAAPSASPIEDAPALGRNLLAFGAGTLVVGVTSEAAQSDAKARQLIDEAEFIGWSSADGQVENQSVTLELPARTTLKTIVFDTANLAYAPVAPKDVKIEVSDVSATGGFQTILEATLADGRDKSGADGQAFPVAEAVAGRWVRYTARNNLGSPKKIFTKELRGYGEQETPAPVPNVSGTYKVGGIIGDGVHLKQEGNQIIGCYSENDGIVEGTIEGRTITLAATENNARAKNEKTSFVAANVVEGGGKFLSAWWGWSKTPTKKLYDRLLTGEKVSERIGNCKHLPNLDGAEDAAKSQLEKSLEATGRAVLYGINFDFNSDVIKPESRPTLEKVAALLKEKPDWRMNVEGHTDNVGGESFNQTLSEKRAASVKKYLTGAGIGDERLGSVGYGLSKPLAPNNSEAERAQNRRVELVKQ